MDHPEFVGEHWLDTFRNHVQEIHKRGHRLSVRQAPLDMTVVMKAFEGSNSKFDVTDEVRSATNFSFFLSTPFLLMCLFLGYKIVVVTTSSECFVHTATGESKGYFGRCHYRHGVGVCARLGRC